MEKYSGLIATNGTHWHDVRRFTLRHLRDLGMGKSKMVSAVQFEASELVESMKKDAGKSKPLTTDIKIAVINVLWQMVASKRYKFDDKMVLEFDDLMNKLQNNFGYLMLEYVDEHQKNLDENNPRDFIDDYLIEIERQKSNPDSTMSIRDLLGCTADLFGAGYQTTATAICWSIYYMSKFPETQRKLQKEIDEVLTNKRQASLEDKPRLPYTEAFINETLRYASQTQFHLPRTVTKDTKLLGYTIPKDSLIFPAAEAVHYDRSHFDSPKEFRPERFLNSNGRFEFPKSGYFPFGTGKRQCIGESLARMELLIFITTLVQRLQFSIPNGETLNISPQDIPLFNMPRFDQNILIKIRN
ncbi:cytochrome P450 2L1 [Armadillidium vulgare]|nr:cytochrome P450 2L1 [Armadillidium vulgare]